MVSPVVQVKKESNASSCTACRVVRFGANTVLHSALAIVGVCVVWLAAQNYTVPFSWHVILCTLGYMPLMAEAVLIFSNDNAWIQSVPRKSRYYVHGVLMTLAVGFAVAGMSIEINAKGPNGHHFGSTHAKLGLASMVFILAAVVVGVLVAKSQLINNLIRPVWIKFIHNLLGQVGFILGLICLCYGFQKGWFRRNSSEQAIVALTVVTGIACIWSLITALMSCCNQLRMIIKGFS